MIKNEQSQKSEMNSRKGILNENTTFLAFYPTIKIVISDFSITSGLCEELQRIARVWS